MDEKYTWVETHKELTEYLCTKEESQQELINLLKSVGIGPFYDMSKEGERDIELTEIDPFTFFCYIHKYGDDRRLKNLQLIAEILDIKKPFGVEGIPTTDARKVWMFPPKYLRINNEISRLWSFFNKEIKGEVTNEDFADVLKIKNIGLTNLTEALFYINPEKYLPINAPTKQYIRNVLDVDTKYNTYSQYIELLSKIREKTDMPFYKLSYVAWEWTAKKDKVSNSVQIDDDGIGQENIFEMVRDKFNLKFGNQLFENYTKNLKRIVSELNLKPNDPRIVFSIRSNKINFTIGQRYCFNIFLSNQNGVYGFISTEKIRDNSVSFDGMPKAYFTYKNNDDFNITRQEWKSMIEAMKIELNRTTKSGYIKNNNKDFENYVFNITSTYETTPIPEKVNYPLNTIFYGPPGTGKTYNTILRATEIVENRYIDNYEEAIKIFNSKLHDQIEFITFHQNYSYEDFIQGIRPDTDNNEELTFEKRDGVFKLIADRALRNLKESENLVIPKKSFNDAFNKFISPLEEGEVEEIEVKMTKVSYYITAVTSKSINFRKDNGSTIHTLSISTLGRMYEAETDLEIKGLQHYYNALLNELLKIGKDKSGINEKVEKKNYVIIIDEINRANISRVFGELITLIEEDKRSHGSTPLETKLPSGDKFIVPSNLYIIGTMNTADKSIALLDIALRRRFVFEAMYPLYEINGKMVNDADILEKLNKKIIETKGYDFQIGHSYFMCSNGEAFNLVDCMNNKVIPLLQEYYMNDDKEVKEILKFAGLTLDENPWPLRIKNGYDKSI
jgi:hypothetical protein